MNDQEETFVLGMICALGMVAIYGVAYLAATAFAEQLLKPKFSLKSLYAIHERDQKGGA